MSGAQPVAGGTLAGLIGILLGLFMFGCLYAALVYWLGDRKEGHTSLLVVWGVLVTMAGIAGVDALTGWPAVLITGICFVCTGLPMIAGDVIKDMVHREELLKRQVEQATREAVEGQKTAEAPDDQA